MNEGYLIKKFGNKYFIRIDKNHEIISTLKEISEKKKIRLGVVSGIGAIKSCVLGFFNPETKEYSEKTFSEYMEITSLTGNITRKEKNTYLHLHLNAAGSDNKTIGGHLVKAVISATSEIVIEEARGKVNRKFSEEIGLNLIEM